jgi:dipeptidyl-peptidase-4
MKGSLANPETEFLTLAQLNEILKNNGLQESATMPDIQFNKGVDWIVKVNGNRVVLDPKTKRLFVSAPSLISERTQEASKIGMIAYVDNGNLFVLKNGINKQVTSDGNKDIVYGAAVHRSEFGISKGLFWSNDGHKLAFYRMDQSMVTDYPIINWSTKIAKNENIKYPMAGDRSHEVTIGVFDPDNSQLVYLNTGSPKDQYLTNIAWSPDDKFIYVAIVNREQTLMKLNKYDANTGFFIKTLFEEKDDKYVEPLVPMLFVKNNPTQFIWESNRDGWNHLYLYDTTGKMLKQLTTGNWEVIDVKGFDSRGDNLWYTSTAASPITRNLYRLNIKSASSTRVTEGEGIHTTQLSSEGSFVIDNFSSPSTPQTINIVDAKSGKAKSILQAADPLKGFSVGRMSIASLNTANGDLYYRLYRPVNFDSTKKYPVVVYWYGGPHVQIVTDAYNGGAADYWFQWLAERGVVVFSIDTRGSDNRGKQFEQSIFRLAGEKQMEDMMAGVDFLKKLSYVDASRMALFGWSYGGFMTLDFMETHPGIFKAAIAGGPVTNWKLYEVMYGERYMDMPKENPDGYSATDLTKRVDQLKGKLLIIHGLQDPVVVQQHSVNFVRACIDKDIQVDYMIYPGHEHNVKGKDRAHLYQKISDYIFQNLDIKN